LARRYGEIKSHGVEVVAIGPDSAERLRQYWDRHHIPFRAVADPSGALLAQWGQEVSWRRLGRMPALAAVAKDGQIVHTHHGRSMADLPDIDAALSRLAP
jgi:peroxiredoxin